ncbi:MAG: McrB family protein [Bacillaceae bacterium]
MNKVTNRVLSVQEKQMIEETYMIGRLYDDENSFRRAISLGENGDRRFIVEPLSPMMSLLQEIMDYNDVFISYDTRQYNYLANYEYFSAKNKEAKMREILKNKILLFKPQLRYNSKTKRYIYNFEILLDDHVDKHELNSEFIPIPIMNINVKEFETKLLEGKIISLESYNHGLNIPKYIICKDTLYFFPDSNSLTKYEARKDTYKCELPEQIVKCELPKNWHDIVKGATRHLCFVSSVAEKSLSTHLQSNGTKLVNRSTEGMIVNSIEEEIEARVIVSKEAEKVSENVHIINESKFIDDVYQTAVDEGLMYRMSDIVNLHTSLKTSTITILGGMSGTGKTQLARVYAKTMGLVEGETLLTIPVSPSFTEPSDLLGFLNHQTKCYLESETGLVSFLYKAQQNPHQMFMVIFDEMNIGQVEHYFSDFISLLELPSENRILRLFSGESNCNDKHLIPGIKIGDNVLFVGTANFDETTKDFSNRMLDRSNVILLEKLSFKEAKENALAAQRINREDNKNRSISFSNYNSWIRKGNGLDVLADSHVQLLDSLHDEMSEYDSQMGVSFRMVNAIIHFISNIPIDKNGNPYIDDLKAFDYQVKQRILTKIRGHREQIEHLVGSINHDGEYEEGRLLAILHDKQAFPISRAYLMQKSKELVRNGYTL